MACLSPGRILHSFAFRVVDGCAVSVCRLRRYVSAWRYDAGIMSEVRVEHGQPHPSTCWPSRPWDPLHGPKADDEFYPGASLAVFSELSATDQACGRDFRSAGTASH